MTNSNKGMTVKGSVISRAHEEALDELLETYILLQLTRLY